MVEFDSETLFNTAAAAVATIAVLFFLLNVEFPYSPVSKYALVVAFLAGVFALTQRTGDRQLTVLGYAVVVVSTVGLFFELTNTFNVPSVATVFGLLLVAGLFFWLRTRLDEKSRFVSGRRATQAVAVLGAIAAVILVVDVATGGLVYELQPQSQVTIPGSEERREQLVVATLAVQNPTPFPEGVSPPEYGACTAGNWSAYRPTGEEAEEPRPIDIGVHVDVDWDRHIFGFSTARFPVRLHLFGSNLTGETFPVRVTDGCPDDESGQAYIALFEQERGRYPTPV